MRRLLTRHEVTGVVTVSHLDAEVLSAHARLVRAGLLETDEVAELLTRLASMAMQRLPVTADLLGAARGSRENVAARHALDVAAAASIGATLVTTDVRLARSVPVLVVDLG